MNIQQSIHKNNQTVMRYMVIMTIVIGVLGHLISSYFHFGLTGTGCFLLLAGLINFFAYFFSDTLVVKSSGAKPITREMIPDYFERVESMVQQAQIPMPKLYFIDEAAMNAFASGRNANKAVVVVTRGLLEKLTLDEVTSVVAHELAHIQFNDMRLMAVVSVLAGLISILADLFWYSNLVNAAQDKDRSGMLTFVGLALALFAPICMLFVKLAISREREFAADAQSAAITGKPLWLVSALEKIKRDQIPLPHVNAATAHLYISNPNKNCWIDTLFSTHPDINERIERLNQIASTL